MCCASGTGDWVVESTLSARGTVGDAYGGGGWQGVAGGFVDAEADPLIACKAPFIFNRCERCSAGVSARRFAGTVDGEASELGS